MVSLLFTLYKKPVQFCFFFTFVLFRPIGNKIDYFVVFVK